MIELPEGTVATAADLDTARLDVILEAADSGYYFYHSALESAAKAAVVAQEYRWAKVLDVLADACSMSLVPGSASEPFQPYVRMANRRSFMPQDYLSADIELIAEVAPLISDKLLAARLYDVAWHCIHPRAPQHASDAIDAYRSITLTEDSWIADGRECWYRAIALARMRRDPRLADIVDSIRQALFRATPAEGFLALWLARALKEHGLAKDSATQIATHLRAIADAVRPADDRWQARDHYGGAAEWYKVANDDLNESAMLVEIARSLYAEAVARSQSEHPSYMAASSFIEDAIQVLRSVPRVLRPQLGVEGWDEQLQIELREVGERAIQEMQTVSSGPIDLSELIQSAEQAVAGKPLQAAIAALATVCSPSRYDYSEDQAKLALRAHPLMASMSANVIGRYGQVVAKRPGFDLADPDAEGNKTAVRAQMVQTQTQVMGLRVKGIILPALEALKKEHRIPLDMLVQIAGQTSFVPPGRERLVALGLHYGFEEEWATAVHLLVPQLENLVRHHIKHNGAVTTVMDKEGVVNEFGLSTLMTLPQVEAFFGADYAFELRALFCDHFGPNLRNELAHGLLGDREAYSAESVYAWWMMLHLVIAAWRYERMGRGREHAPSAEDSERPADPAVQSETSPA